MAWEHIEYGYATAHLFHKMLMWVSANCNVYFSLKLNSDDSWIYYSGNASHALETGLKLTLCSTESEAQTNYLTTTRDSNGKVLTVLPAIYQAKYVRVYIQSGSGIVIREFRPSTFFTAHEIITGELEISDQLSDAPKIRVTKDGVDRVKIGNLHGDTYGIGGYTANASLLFELSASRNTIASWDITKSNLKSGNIILDAKNDKITVNTITIDGANDRIRSSNYVSGTFGAGFSLSPDLLEVGNIRARGMIHTAVFQKDVISAVGGSLLVAPSDVLSVDVSATNTHITLEENANLEVGDVLRIKDGSYDEWMEITDVSNAPTYGVTRDKSNYYEEGENPAWTKGTSIVRYGASGDGLIRITSDETNSPFISISTNEGSPWGGITEQVRLGNLNGFLDYLSDLYGIGIGDNDQYLKYDITNGLRISGRVDVSQSSFFASNIFLTFEGSIITNEYSTYPYIEISSAGIQLKDSDTGGTYGTAIYSTDLYGYGALVWILSPSVAIPWAELKEPHNSSDQAVASFRLYNRSGDPDGPAEIGDLAVVNGKLKICSIAGGAGSATWISVGSTCL